MTTAKILLTGGTGFLGEGIVEEFGRQGVKPKCMVRPSSRSGAVDAHGLEKVEGDLLDARSLEAALEGVDTVVHAAAVTGSPGTDENMRVNHNGSLNLIQACKRRGVRRMVVVSTIAAETERRGAYGESKRMADEAFLAGGLDVTIIRASLIFGRGSRQIDSIRKFITLIPGFIPVIGDGRYLLQPVWIGDVAKVVVSAALRKPPKNMYHAAGPRKLSFDDILTGMSRRMGKNKILVHLPYFFVHSLLTIAGKIFRRLPVNAAQAETLCQDAVCAVEETERDFGIQFMPFDRILDRMAERGGAGRQLETQNLREELEETLRA